MIRVPIPPQFDKNDSDFDLKDYFNQFIEGELHPALDTEVWEFDERASVYEIEIADVIATSEGVVIEYRVLFDVYYGCSDMNYAGDDERQVSGKRDGEHWVFAHNKPREPRSTRDEF